MSELLTVVGMVFNILFFGRLMKRLFLFILFTLTVGDSFSEEFFVETEENSRLFPIWGEDAKKLGYDLPNPFGISLIYMGMDQDLTVESIDLSFEDPVIDAIIGGLDIDAYDAELRVDNVTLRADMWVFPFLNLYGVLGQTNGEVRAKANISGDALNLSGAPIHFNYEGVTYGAGMTFAGGYKSLFTIVDMNFTHTKLNIVDGTTEALVISPRVGYNTKLWDKPFRVWLGAMYQDFDQTIEGDVYDIIDLGPIGDVAGPGKFEVSQKGTHAWNYTSGFSIEFNKKWDLIFEAGFGKNRSFMVGTGFRF